MNRTRIKILLILVIFTVSITTYYYPVFKKGFAPGAGYSNLTQARNFALSGTYFNESADGVYLSSESAPETGAPKGVSNPLNSIIYGHIFKYFGFDSELPLYISIILFSLFNVLVFLLSARLFGTAIGFVSGMASAFIPVMTIGAIHGAFYEWGLIFFGLALWFYLGAKAGPFKSGLARTLLASVFFALAALSRNAFAISFVPFFLYDFFIHRSYRRSLVFLLPFVILFGSTLSSYSWLGVPNGYTAGIEQQPFSQVGHFFHDPYTFYYDRDNFIEEMTNNKLARVAVSFATNWGYDVSLTERLSAYFESFTFYVKELISLTSTGGPFIWGLIILGISQLYYVNKKLLGLFIAWGFFWLGYLVYAQTGNWDHIIEIVFILAVTIGLGIFRLVNIISKNRFKKIFSGLLIFVIFIGHLAYANFWKLHDFYRSSKEEIVLDIKNKIDDQDNVGGVYAVGIHPSSVNSLNYRINHDVVYFAPETIEKLIRSGRLQDAFDKYNISMIIGYSSEISSKIEKELNIPAISGATNK